MAKTYEVNFQLAAQMAGNFAKVMGSAAGALDAINQQMTGLSGQKAAVDRIIELRGAVERSSAAYASAKANAEQLAAEISAVGTPTKKMAAEFGKASKAADQAEKSLQREREELDQLTTKLNAADSSTADLVRRQEQLAAAAKKAAGAQESLQKVTAAQAANKAARDNYRGQMMDAVGLAASLAAPIKLAADWEQSLAELNKVANGTPEEIAAIAKEAQALAVSTGVAREGIIGAYNAAAQAGFAREEWAQFAEVSAKMGVAFDTTGDKAGEMLKAWRSSMGLTMDQATELAAAANHLANNMNASALDIGDVLQRQGAVLKSAGLSDAQGAALAASMLSGGAASEVAATASKNFLMALTKGNSGSSAQKAALAALGFDDPVQLAKDMQEAPELAIMAVLRSIQELDAHEQTATMASLFGSESIGGIAPLVANLDNLAGAFKLVGDRADYASSLESEFAAMQGTTQQQAKKAMEGAKALGTAIGGVLLPPINSMLATVAPLALKMAEFAQENQGVTTAIVGAAAAFMAIKVAAIAGGYAFTFVKGAVLSVQAAMAIGRTAWLLYTGAMTAGTTASKAAIVISKAMTAAQWLFNAAMTANPIGLVIAGIAALIAAGVALYKNWDTVVAWLGSAWDNMKAWASAAIDGVVGFFQRGFEFIKNVFLMFHPLGWMMGGFDKLTSWLSSFSLFESGAKLLQTLGDGIKSAVSAPVDAIKGALEKVRDFLPFSDAKVGPLSELTASGQAIMTTLGDGMGQANTAEVTAPLASIGQAASGAGLAGGADAGGAGAGGVHIEFSPQIIVQGGGSDVYDQARRGVAAGADELMNQLRAFENRERRLSYA